MPSRSVVGGVAVSPRGHNQQSLEAKVAQLEAMVAANAQAAKEKEAQEEEAAKTEASAAPAAHSAGLAALAWKGAAREARRSVAAGAAGAPPAAEHSDSSEDDEDEPEAAEVGITRELLESHSKPNLNKAQRSSLALVMRPSVKSSRDPDTGRRAAGEPGELAAMLAAMQAELQAVKDQNAKIQEENDEFKLAQGGEMGADKEEALLEAYKVLLAEVRSRHHLATISPPSPPNYCT